jgi:hypothetical protein
VSIDDGSVAFSSGLSGIDWPFTIYSDVGGTMQRIIGRSDQFFGETIKFVRLGPDSLSGNQIIFHVWFEGGNEGVYIATIREPGSFAAFSVAAMVCMRRLRTPGKAAC